MSFMRIILCFTVSLLIIPFQSSACPLSAGESLEPRTITSGGEGEEGKIVDISNDPNVEYSPRIISFEGKMYVFWLRQALSKTGAMAIAIMMRVYNGTWSQTLYNVAGDDVFDMNFTGCIMDFDVCVYNGKLYVVWVYTIGNEGRIMDEGIYLRGFDGENWSRIVTVKTSHRNGEDRMCKMVVFRDSMYIFWITDDSYFTDGQDSEIIYLTYDGKGFSEISIATDYPNRDEETKMSLISDDKRIYLMFQKREKNIAKNWKISVIEFDGFYWKNMQNLTHGEVDVSAGTLFSYGTKMYASWQERWHDVNEGWRSKVVISIKENDKWRRVDIPQRYIPGTMINQEPSFFVYQKKVYLMWSSNAYPETENDTNLNVVYAPLDDPEKVSILKTGYINISDHTPVAISHRNNLHILWIAELPPNLEDEPEWMKWDPQPDWEMLVKIEKYNPYIVEIEIPPIFIEDVMREIKITIRDSNGAGVDGMNVTIRFSMSESTISYIIPMIGHSNGMYSVEYAFPRPGAYSMKVYVDGEMIWEDTIIVYDDDFCFTCPLRGQEILSFTASSDPTWTIVWLLFLTLMVGGGYHWKFGRKKNV